MGITQIRDTNPSQQDPYWVFDISSHYKPKISKGDFFRLSGYDFGWLILEPLTQHLKGMEKELEHSKQLSYGQKALYFWWYVDAQVTNGGFVQFYYNGYGTYVPTVIKALTHIGDKKMADLISKADKIFQRHKSYLEKMQSISLFEGDLYEKLDDLSLCDALYYDLHDTTIKKIEDYIRKNPNDFCLDENGHEIDPKYSGVCETFHPNKLPKEQFLLQNGKIDGVFKSFHENGRAKEIITYNKGIPDIAKEEYYENGNLKYLVKFDEQNKLWQHCQYHENGNMAQIEHRRLDDFEITGVFKKWHENGQIMEEGQYLTEFNKQGIWREYHSNGTQYTEISYQNGETKILNCWDQDGTQTLKDGNGIYQYNYENWDGSVEKNIHQYENYLRHGKQYTYLNDTLIQYQETAFGLPHGIARTYYKTGQLKEEIEFENGEELSNTKFSLFEDPVVITTLEADMKDEWLRNRDLSTAEIYPRLTNRDLICKQMTIPIDLFEGYPPDEPLSYNYLVEVDQDGQVSGFHFSSADNARVADIVETNIPKLQFIPALNEGQKVPSYIYLRFIFSLAENMS